jgi:hypothetical protein
MRLSEQQDYKRAQVSTREGLGCMMSALLVVHMGQRMEIIYPFSR